MKPPGTIRIGISGWSYEGWRGVFYPEELARRDELAYASRKFSSIEINATFYRLQRPEHFGSWKETTPAGFVFAVKGPRYVTHMLKLKSVNAAFANFFASGVLRLGPKLGPILWQFPPQTWFDAARFESFLRLLPRNTRQALMLARRHDSRTSGRSWLRPDRVRPLRHAIEIRHESFCVPEFIALLRRLRTALVCADTPGWPFLSDVTADFIYCRLHGSEQLYASGYGEPSLAIWAKRIDAWARGGEPDEHATRGRSRETAAERPGHVRVF